MRTKREAIVAVWQNSQQMLVLSNDASNSYKLNADCPLPNWVLSRYWELVASCSSSSFFPFPCATLSMT